MAKKQVITDQFEKSYSMLRIKDQEIIDRKIRELILKNQKELLESSKIIATKHNGHKYFLADVSSALRLIFKYQSSSSIKLLDIVNRKFADLLKTSE